MDVAGNVEDWQSTSFAIVDDTPPVGEVELELDAAPRCVAGRVFVAITARNDNEVPVDVEFLGDYGTRSFTGVVPDRFASHAFNTRATTIDAGSIVVRASAVIDGVEVVDEWTVEFAGLAC